MDAKNVDKSLMIMVMKINSGFNVNLPLVWFISLVVVTLA